ncbi:hypothetical protein [Salininema proteolyticum]|uniref:Lipoprotein n=1 Tax=Salininema proteolyticum TaxID=1607685 RepID=A0ABV8TTG9_9ACTN
MTTKSVKSATAVALSAAFLLSACSDGDNPSDDGGSPSDGGNNGFGESGASSVINEWEPCEVFDSNFNELVEHYEYDGLPDDRISAGYGEGTPSDLVECSANVMWEKDPNSKLDRLGIQGLTTVAVVASGSPEATSERFDELVNISRDLHERNSTFEDSEIQGDWDKGVLLHGDYGKGDTWAVYVLDGPYLIKVLLETGSNMSGGDGGSSEQSTFEVNEVRDYLVETSVPGMQETVDKGLQEAGVNIDE